MIMFVFLATMAMLCYALQGALLANLYRRLDPLSVVAFRGLSLSITMSPILFLATTSSGELGLIFPLVAISSFFMVTANWAVAMAFRTLSVGVTSTFCMSSMVVFACSLGVFALGEAISFSEAGWIFLIITGLICLGLSSRNASGCLVASVSSRGILYCVLHGFIAANGFFIFTVGARQGCPLLAAYLLEALTGVFAGLAVLARNCVSSRQAVLPDFRVLIKIALYSSPTVIATACYSIAITIGPLSIAAIILSFGLVMSYLFGWALYREAITRTQGVISLVLLMALGFLNYS